MRNNSSLILPFLILPEVIDFGNLKPCSSSIRGGGRKGLHSGNRLSTYLSDIT